MNLLLSKFNENDNKDLSTLLSSYQEYFQFVKKDNNINL